MKEVGEGKGGGNHVSETTGREKGRRGGEDGG